MLKLLSAQSKCHSNYICKYLKFSVKLQTFNKTFHYSLGLRGEFSHILIDEAGQALECEAIMPFLLSNDETRIVLAGDHMQMTLPVRCPLAKSKDFHISLLERLGRYYASETKSSEEREKFCIFLNENYRCHPRLVSFLSQNIYGEEKARSRKSQRFTGHCLHFEHSDGHEECLNFSYINVDEIERVYQILKNLKTETLDKVCVISYYQAQVSFLREYLRKQSMKNVTVLNTESVQGQEYDIVIISIVRTKEECSDYEQLLGYLSDPKLINTSLSRSKSMVYVVGNAYSMLNLGSCTGLWHNYIELCNQLKTFNSLTISHADLKTLLKRKRNSISFKWMRETDADLILEILAEEKSKFSPKKINTKKERRNSKNRRDNASELSELIKEDSETFKRCKIRSNGRDKFCAEPEEGGKIAIANCKNRGIALQNDTAVVEIFPKKSESGNDIGRVKGILNTAKSLFICWPDFHSGFAIPINNSIPKIRLYRPRETSTEYEKLKTIYIYKMDNETKKVDKKTINPSNPHKFLLVVRYIEWKKMNDYPLGVAIEEIELLNDKVIIDDILQIEHNINHNVTPNDDVLKCVEKSSYGLRLLKELANNRKDLTSLYIFTIDPFRARVLDDAISVEDIDDKTLRVGVHIADVSCFVDSCNELGKKTFMQAIERGTTIPTRTGKLIHMLPENLSTDTCSIICGRKRLTKSLFFTINVNGVIESIEKPVNSIIQSKKRFTYEIFQRVLETEYEFDKSLINIDKLYTCLINHRKNRDEALISSNCNDHKLMETYLMLEELMIIANITLTEFMQSFKNIHMPKKSLKAPDKEKSAKWMNYYGKLSQQSPEIKKIACRLQDFESNETEASVKISKHSLEELMALLDKNDKNSLRKSRSVCNDYKNFPKQLMAISDFHKISEKSEFVCSCTGEENRHFIFNRDVYSSFTSPLRKIIDLYNIVLLNKALEGRKTLSSHEETLKVIDSYKKNKLSGKNFEKDIKTYDFGFEFKAACLTFEMTLQSIDCSRKFIETSPTHFPYLKDEDRVIFFRSLNLSEEPKISEDDNSIILKWRKRIYMYNKGNTMNEKENMLKNFTDNEYCKEIKEDKWLRLLNLLQNIDSVNPKLNSNLIQVVNDVKTDLNKHVKHYSSDVSHDSENSEGFIDDDKFCWKINNFVEFSFTLKKGDLLKGQIGSGSKWGLFVPRIQYLKITPNYGICLQHFENPASCFSEHPSTKIKPFYGNIDEYRKILLPIIELEGLSSLQGECSVTIQNISIRWFTKSNNTSKMQGRFNISKEFCEKRNINIDVGNCFCIIYNNLRDYDNSKHKSYFSSNFKDCKYESDDLIWICHAVCSSKENQKNEEIVIHLEVKTHNFEFPEVLDKENHCANISIYHLSETDQVKIQTISKINETCEFVKDFIIGKEFKNTCKKFSNILINSNLSGSLGESLEMVANHKVTLIQGLAGTGKTYLCCHIIEQYVKMNKKNKKKGKIMYCASTSMAANDLIQKLETIS